MMSPPASHTEPPSKDSDQEDDLFDPLQDYCEDYAWDPSDWDLETGHFSGHWDLSDVDELMPSSPQSSKASPMLRGSTIFRSPREIRNVPHVELDMSFFQAKEGNQEGNSNHGTKPLIYSTSLTKHYSFIKKALEFVNKKWIFFKWILIVLNVVIEVCQATFSQENAQGKLSTPFYLKLNILTSAFCLMISLVETIHEGKKSKVVWRTRGYVGWFYYPGRERRLFGRFSLIFGVFSSMVQLCINLVALVINKNFLKFDTLPLLLSFGYLVAAMVDQEGQDRTKSEVPDCSWSGVEEVYRYPSFEWNLIQVDSGWSYSSDELLSSITDQFGSYSSLQSIEISSQINYL